MKRIQVDFNLLREDNSLLVTLPSLANLSINEEVVVYDNEEDELRFLGRVRALDESTSQVTVGVTWGAPYGD